MLLMEEKILTEGQVLPGGILKVGSFLNQQIDTAFLRAIGQEIARLYGESGWGDYAVEVDVTFLDSKKEGGLLVRAAQPALGGPGNSPKLGSDFLLGYYVSLGDGEVVLTRLAYESHKSVRAPVPFDISDKVKLRVEALENRIEVFVDGKSVLVYDDPEPFIVGRVGVRTCGSKMRFENLRVEPLSSGRQNLDGETDGKDGL